MSQKVKFGMSFITAHTNFGDVDIPIKDIAQVMEMAEQAVLGMRAVDYYPTPASAAELWRRGEFADAIVDLVGHISFFIHDLPVKSEKPADSKVIEYGADLIPPDKLAEADQMRVEAYVLSNMLVQAVSHTDEVLARMALMVGIDPWAVKFPFENMSALGLVMSSGTCSTPFRLRYLANIGCSLDSIFKMESENDGHINPDLHPDALKELIQLAATFSVNASDKSELVMLAREMMGEATQPVMKKIQKYYTSLLTLIQASAPAEMRASYSKRLDDLYWEAKKYVEQFAPQNSYVNPVQHTLEVWNDLEQDAARLAGALGTGQEIAELCTLGVVSNLHYLPGQFSSKLHNLNVETLKQLKANGVY